MGKLSRIFGHDYGSPGRSSEKHTRYPSNRRELERRAARQALNRVGLFLRPVEYTGFYRPAMRPDPRPRQAKRNGKDKPEQLLLNFNVVTLPPRDPERPLVDVFPDAYE